MSTMTTPAATAPRRARAVGSRRRRHRGAPTAAAPGADRPGARAVVGLAAPAVLLLLWWAVTAAGLLSAVQLPSPGGAERRRQPAGAGRPVAARGDLHPARAAGLPARRRTRAGRGVRARAVPVGRRAVRPADRGAARGYSLAWVPLLILWMQIGEESKVTLIAIGAFFPVFTTVYAALRHVDPHLVEAGRAFGLPRAVPAADGSCPPWCRPCSPACGWLAQAWLFLVAAELIASSMGLGFTHRLAEQRTHGPPDLAIILLAVLGKLTDGCSACWSAGPCAAGPEPGVRPPGRRVSPLGGLAGRRVGGRRGACEASRRPCAP